MIRYRMTSLSISLPALAALMLLGGCSGKPAEEEAAEPVALVSLGEAQAGGVAETVSVYGITDSGSGGTSTLVAPAEAVVATLDAPIGTAVSTGQVVAHLLPSPGSKLDSVKAMSDAAAADAAYARAKRLRADNLISDGDVETAAAAAHAADATSATSKLRLDGMTLKSPQSGYVVSVAQTPGDQVPAGAGIVTISSLGNLRARFGVDPGLAQKIRTDALIHITPASGAAFDAHVIAVSPVVDPQTRLAPVIAVIPQGTGLGSGQALRGELAIDGSSEALTIPYSALLDDGGQPYVFRVIKGVAHRADVKTGPQSGDRIAILKGLAVGDAVVTVGVTALEDGMKVRLK